MRVWDWWNKYIYVFIYTHICMCVCVCTFLYLHTNRNNLPTSLTTSFWGSSADTRRSNKWSAPTAHVNAPRSRIGPVSGGFTTSWRKSHAVQWISGALRRDRVPSWTSTNAQHVQWASVLHVAVLILLISWRRALWSFKVFRGEATPTGSSHTNERK